MREWVMDLLCDKTKEWLSTAGGQAKDQQRNGLVDVGLMGFRCVMQSTD
jgi:hypothetical protein